MSVGLREKTAMERRRDVRDILVTRLRYQNFQCGYQNFVAATRRDIYSKGKSLI
jgi:hypothetical protein